MDLIKLRKIARAMLAFGATGLIGGGVVIALGLPDLGDIVMVAGGISLLVGALLLTRTPTGDKDPS
tara:strand:+ start:765 stop:962 length:198 start_codon:yes stop_codon:yes gene_type:complete